MRIFSESWLKCQRLAFLLLVSVGAVAHANAKPVILAGLLGKASITMVLNVEQEQVQGFYSYDKNQRPIYLKGTLTHRHLALHEYATKNPASLANDSIEGELNSEEGIFQGTRDNSKQKAAKVSMSLVILNLPASLQKKIAALTARIGTQELKVDQYHITFCVPTYPTFVYVVYDQLKSHAKINKKINKQVKAIAMRSINPAWRNLTPCLKNVKQEEEEQDPTLVTYNKTALIKVNAKTWQVLHLQAANTSNHNALLNKSFFLSAETGKKIAAPVMLDKEVAY